MGKVSLKHNGLSFTDPSIQSLDSSFLQSWQLSLVLATLVSFGTGALCWYLHAWLATVQQPIYDSMSYLDGLHRTMSLTRSEGWLKGVEAATRHNTVCLPYLFSIPLAWLFAPARWIGTLFQTCWLLIFLFSIDRMLVRLQRRIGGRTLALASFSALAVTWFSNGGLGDFRMDLSLMLGYGSAVTLLILGIQSAFEQTPDRQSNRHWQSSWLFLGAVLGGICLVRATAPVYLILAIAPVLLGMGLVSRRVNNVRAANQIAWGAIISAGVATLMGAWFYLMNFEYLKYYYLVWNTDANAKLPLNESIAHLQMVYRQIGVPAFMLGVVVMGIAVKQRIAVNQRLIDLKGWMDFGQINRRNVQIVMWVGLWCSLVPVSMLVIGGAGMNPFVSMPTTSSLFILWAVLVSAIIDRSPPMTRMLVSIMVVLAIGGGFARGVKKHVWPNDQFMAAHHLAIENMIADADVNQLKHIRFGSLALTDVHTDSLWSAIQFDRTDFKFQGIEAWRGEIRFEPSRLLMLPPTGDRQNVPGDSDLEKRTWLVRQTGSKFDYLILPDAPTAIRIHQLPSSDVINQHLIELRQMLIAHCRLKRVASLTSPTSDHYYELYRVE